MKERIRNALKGFGLVTDAERDAQIEAVDSVPRVDLGYRRVSLWGHVLRLTRLK